MNKSPFHKMYKTAEWKRIRAGHLKDHPLCEMCLQDGFVILAEVVDHKKPHKGNLTLFRDRNNLQSLCQIHHNGAKQREDVRGHSTAIGLDGWPK